MTVVYVADTAGLCQTTRVQHRSVLICRSTAMLMTEASAVEAIQLKAAIVRVNALVIAVAFLNISVCCRGRR